MQEYFEGFVLKVFSRGWCGLHGSTPSVQSASAANLPGDLRNDEVEEFHSCAGSGRNRRGFGWTEVDAHTLAYLMIFILEVDFALPFHQVDELMFVAGAGFELFSGLEPAQHSKHILGARQFMIQDLGHLALRRLLARKLIGIDEGRAWHRNLL